MSGPANQQQSQYLSDMVQMDTAHKTMMWQQSQYMVDSGIQSGSTTHAPPSVSGKHDGTLDTAMDASCEDTASRLIYDFDNGFTHGRFPPNAVDGMLTVMLAFVKKSAKLRI